MRATHRAMLAAATFFVACGGAQTQTAPTTSTARQPERPRPADDEASSGGMTIEGQLGYLSQSALSNVLTPATSQLAACYNDRLGEHPFLAGRIELKFRIGADGAPVWVIPLSSTLGDRPTEQCMVERAMALRFPRPRGGETETTYPLELSGGDDARPADPWPADRLEHVFTQHRGALTQCLHGASGPLDITLYASPHGRVATAGVAVPNQQAAGAVDCIVHEVSGWHVPDPGSWYARTTLRLE